MARKIGMLEQPRYIALVLRYKRAVSDGNCKGSIGTLEAGGVYSREGKKKTEKIKSQNEIRGHDKKTYRGVMILILLTICMGADILVTIQGRDYATYVNSWSFHLRVHYCDTSPY